MSDIYMNILTKKSIIITGGYGHIGSHLALELIAMGNAVTIIDNNSNNSVCHIDNAKIYTMHYKDIDKIEDADKYEYLFHLGEYARVEQSLQDFDKCFENNMHMHKILDFCRSRDVKLIYAGSSTKFTKNVSGFTLSPYTFTKFVNSELVNMYAKWYGLDYAIVYFHNVYGGNEHSTGKYATVVGKFLALAKQGSLTLPVTSPGTQIRNFTHILDTVEALVLVALKGHGDGYGIASDEEISIIELTQLIGLEADLQPASVANRMETAIHNQKLKKLGWTAKKSLKDYIKAELEKC